jgi:hypothetical protein
MVSLFLTLVSGFAFADFGVIFRGGIVNGSNNYNYYLFNTYIPYDNTGIISTLSKGDAYPQKDLNDSGFVNFGVEFFSESKLSNTGYFGIRGGYVQYGTDTLYDDFYYMAGHINEWDQDTWDKTGPLVPLKTHEIKSAAYTVPVILYYKHDINKMLSVSGGGGISVLINKWTETTSQETSWNYEAPFVDPLTGQTSYNPVTPYDDQVTETQTKTMFVVNVSAEARLSEWFSLMVDIGYQGNGKTNYKDVERDFSGLYGNLGLKVYAF